MNKPINAPPKRHPVRGALYPLVLAAISLVAFSLACPAATAIPTVTARATATPRPRPTPAPRPEPPSPSPTPTTQPTITPTATLTPSPSPTPTATLTPSLSPTPVPPVAQTATYIGANSFTANWTSVSGATGYRLDV